jgi:arylsulfatase A-like enzyme
MQRRDFIRLASTAGAGVGLTNPLKRAFAQPLPENPNVLFIICDDLNDWIGCLGGHPNALTPNLDAFAESSVLFTNAHACAAGCNPSRTAIFTGLQPSTSNIYFNHQHWENQLGIDYPTMPDRYQEAGYSNLLIGKYYHHDIDWQAWEYVFPVFDYHNLVGLDPFSPYHPHNGLNEQFAGVSGKDFIWGPSDEQEGLMQDSRRADFIVNRLEDGIPEPFFTVFGTHTPHLPNTPPRKYLERFNIADLELPPTIPNDLDDIPPGGLALSHQEKHNQVVGHKAWLEGVRAYLATVNYMDEQIGRVLTALDNSPYADNTVVIITSDHGHHLGEKRHWRKWTNWDESLHVPLMIRVPGMPTAGQVCTHATSLIDVYPTLIDVCNLDPVADLDGQSLRPQLMNVNTPLGRPAISTHSPGNHTVRSTRYRYIVYRENGGEELYDHDIDPHEWNNVADDPAYAEIKASLIEWLPTDGGDGNH